MLSCRETTRAIWSKGSIPSARASPVEEGILSYGVVQKEPVGPPEYSRFLLSAMFDSASSVSFVRQAVMDEIKNLGLPYTV
jgi:hypothetical protein